jgi:hypothetical protein
MTPRIIEIVVSPKGETTLQTKGFAGGECLQASKFLEDALGLAGKDRKTAEFYGARQTEEQHVRQ